MILMMMRGDEVHDPYDDELAMEYMILMMKRGDGVHDPYDDEGVMEYTRPS
jgi:hypothetical protein